MQQMGPDAVVVCVCVLYNMELLMKNNATDGNGWGCTL